MSKDAENYFGEDCPKGMIQVAFVGSSPANRVGDYKWKPEKQTFLDVYVDGKRFHIKVGDFEAVDGTTRRGLHIIGPMDMIVHKHSLNALDVYLPPDQVGEPTI